MSIKKIKTVFSKKKLSGLFFLLLVAFITTIFFILKNNDVLKKSNSSPTSYVVELTPQGFKPDSITIEEGTTVTFVNSKGGPFWPASDSHPAHTIYSTFDSKQAVIDGGSWSFVFNKIGTWRYHDHLSPYFVGKITVVPKLNGKSSLRTACKSDPETKICWTESLTFVLNTEGLDKVFDQIANFYEKKPGFASACHDITHDIGHKAYKNYTQDKDSVLNYKAFYCANGFYHGFMASFLASNQDLNKAKEFCRLVGKRLSSEAPDAELQCFHGIGHGFLEEGFRKSSIVKDEKDILGPAIINCEEVSSSAEQLYRCTSGAFNGIANFYISGEHNFKIDKDNPFLTCENQLEKYKESCYGNFNSVVFWLAKNDLGRASKYILRMNDKTYKEMSIRYLSGMATLSLAKADPVGAVQVCRSMGELKTSCIQGLAHGFLEHGQPNKEWEEAVLFCTNSVMTKDEGEDCLRYTLSGLTGWYSREKSKEICNLIDPDYKKYCTVI